MSGWHIGLTYNLKDSLHPPADAPPDALAEYDSLATVDAVEGALLAGGHSVSRLEADETLPDSLRQARPDICFNIAEGLRGDARESHVPALLEMLDIPYTGSKVLANALSLDKAAAKRIWRDLGLPTAPFQVFRRADEPLERSLSFPSFPLFVKPLREGSGMGISERSIVRDEAALREQVRWVIASYRQPALVEGYLPGRELTVGLIGNALAPGERRSNDLYDGQGYHVFPILEIDVSTVTEALSPYDSVMKGKYALDLNYLCPAPLDEALAQEVKRLAVAAFEAIGALDFTRVDFRLGADGRPYLLEINTLPGLNPDYSDIVIAARSEGVPHTVLINEVLNLALERYGLKREPARGRRSSAQISGEARPHPMTSARGEGHGDEVRPG